MPTMFATYAETPPSTRAWYGPNPLTPNFSEHIGHPQEDLVYYVHNPYAEASSSVV